MMKKSMIFALFGGMALTACHSNDPAEFMVPGNEKMEVSKQLYVCDDGSKLGVMYYNNEPNYAALVNIPDKGKILMVDVPAASGSRYVGNVYEWWTKGDNGTLKQVIENKTIECHQ
ncbi:MliC family protein [Lonsdalea quercina]|uniref:MliC family protein n=2 Tax=Lonsdalea quercina TaxID=71657 RepID=UPI0009DD1984|nr:MliC family protein [Lonsdalea quercina]